MGLNFGVGFAGFNVATAKRTFCIGFEREDWSGQSSTEKGWKYSFEKLLEPGAPLFVFQHEKISRKANAM